MIDNGRYRYSLFVVIIEYCFPGSIKNEQFMMIRLNKVTRDLNVGIATVVDFLQKQGYDIEANRTRG